MSRRVTAEKWRTRHTAERHITCGLRRSPNEEDKNMRRAQATDAGLDKLQDFLLAMVPGDEVSVMHAHDISGLEEATCEAVLGALMRAGLMMRLQHDAYVRVRLRETERQGVHFPVDSA
jgi:hypothetical protein